MGHRDHSPVPGELVMTALGPNPNPPVLLQNLDQSGTVHLCMIHTTSLVRNPQIEWPRLAEPDGVLHWAGAEYATRFNGYLEGAVRSGREVAAAVARNLA